MTVSVIRIPSVLPVSTPYESLYKTASPPFLYPAAATQIFETVIRFLAEGAASGLNVIAVYVTEILRVTGVDGRFQDRPFVCCVCECLGGRC